MNFESILNILVEIASGAVYITSVDGPPLAVDFGRQPGLLPPVWCLLFWRLRDVLHGSEHRNQSAHLQFFLFSPKKTLEM
jgi:hypothetical protein